MAWLIVGATTFVSGGFGIPTGFALGLAAWEVYLAACAGSIGGLVVFLFVGDRATRARSPGRARSNRIQTPSSMIGRIADRFGARGLGLVGPVFPGVTVSPC
jgi:hypothetical protein